jgi:hypothetical protein
MLRAEGCDLLPRTKHDVRKEHGEPIHPTVRDCLKDAVEVLGSSNFEAF